MRAIVIALIAAVLSGQVHGEIRLDRSRADPRLSTVRWSGDNPLKLAVATGSDLIVWLPSGETIQSFNIASASDWQVNAQTGAESFALRPLKSTAAVAMSLVSSSRTYSFVLSSSAGLDAPRLVSIVANEGRSMRDATPSSPSETPQWQLSGSRILWPSAIRDDGAKTYLEWSQDQAIPAVFALDDLGHEQMVNGYMRGTVFTIDRVYQRLAFRIDKASAQARRLEPEARR